MHYRSWQHKQNSIRRVIVGSQGQALVPVFLYGNNGFDPVLGPPYPGQNFEAQVHVDNNPHRLTMTLPDVFIEGEITRPAGGWNMNVSVTNYEWPEWNIATPYIENSRVMYDDIPYFAIEPNTGQQPDLGTGYWIVDDTIFHLFAKGGINDNTGEVIYPDWFEVFDVTVPELDLVLGFALEGLPRPDSVFYLYIKATSTYGDPVYSDNLSFTYIP